MTLLRRSLSVWASLLPLGCAVDAPPAASTPPAVSAPRDPPDASGAASSEPAALPPLEPPALAPEPPLPEALVGLVGRWHLLARGARITANLSWDASSSSLRCSMEFESDAAPTPRPVEVLGWDARGGVRLRQLDAARKHADWYQLTAVDGVLRGRVATGESPHVEPPVTRYTGHVTGWSATRLDRGLYPRTWDLLLDGRERATLRIDRTVGGVTALGGTLKVYASVARGIVDEQPEYDLGVLQWDGTNLVFFIQEGEVQRYFSGTVTGRTISGYFQKPESEARLPFTGERRDVLGYGLAPRSPAERAAWQARARRQIAHLTMAGAPAPVATSETLLSRDLAPFPEGNDNPTRDDAMRAFAPRYRLSEVQRAHEIPNPYGSVPLRRTTHLWVARPTEAPPPGGFPIAVAVNGHWGSARQVMTPNSPYWYGDAFARRGYLVVAVDASHRPLEDRSARYADLERGDDPAGGNGPHPAIRAEGMDSDWEEDGERAWDVMRALDYALEQPDVDPSRAVLVGLSMGGEIATLAGALDPRFAAVISSGFSPDVSVYHYRHHGCWDWAHADLREYIDVSDYHALVAPRALVVQTGTRDLTYSVFSEPFASDKQVLRRSRAAFADVPEAVVHFLHDGAHSFQVGGLRLDAMPEKGVTVPLLVAPDAPWSLSWQSDERTLRVAPTLFDSLGALAR